MKNSNRTRKQKQSLSLRWAEETSFGVPMNVLPRAETRFLKNYTIAIHLRPYATKPFTPQLVVK
jgi:hypothetical protein